MKCIKCDNGEHKYNQWTWRGENWNDIINWPNVKVYGWMFLFSFLFLGFIPAIIICVLFSKFISFMTCPIGVYPKEEYPPNTCSAGIDNCNICNNEYGHEFNLEMNNKNRDKWFFQY